MGIPTQIAVAADVASAVAALILSPAAASQDKSPDSSAQRTTHPAQGQMRRGQMRSSPNAAKVPFDLQFIAMMTRRHQGAVKMAQAASGKTRHAEVKDLARKIIDEQSNEIAQMEKWKKAWKHARK